MKPVRTPEQQKEMNKTYMWRGGMGLTTAAILWLQTQYLTKEAFADYRHNQEELKAELMREIREDIQDLKTTMIRIEARLNELARTKQP
jgi:hypothetical protein